MLWGAQWVESGKRERLEAAQHLGQKTKARWFLHVMFLSFPKFLPAGASSEVQPLEPHALSRSQCTGLLQNQPEDSCVVV